jgi:hypothetical protein
MEKQGAELKKKIKEHEETLRKSKISIILDDYNDIFSDFDPRDYRERALSHDFLFEAKNAAKDKDYETLELSFLVPHKLRNLSIEPVIKKRLREHFKRHHAALHKEVRGIRKKGLIFAIVGIFFGILATLVAVSKISEIWRSILLIIFEPVYWFSVWSGLDHIFFYSQAKKSELDFYEKMTRTNITFQGY